jgi:hypothetical protein
MKKVLSIFAISAVLVMGFAACKSPLAGENKISFGDTAGLAQFQQWKMQNETLDPIAYNAPAKAPVSKSRTTTVRRNTGSSNSGTISTPTTNQAKVKKGWSKSAKYRVIGGAAGGVLGAVIDKKHPVQGAIIGVILGGGGGYVLGRSQDKKDGRF